MESQALGALQAWYAAQCDGSWESRYGVMLATSEASGWELRVDLVETALEGRELPRIRHARTPGEWFEAWCDGFTFRAACGADSLDQLLDAFFDFAERVEARALVSRADAVGELTRDRVVAAIRPERDRAAERRLRDQYNG